MSDELMLPEAENDPATDAQLPPATDNVADTDAALADQDIWTARQKDDDEREQAAPQERDAAPAQESAPAPDEKSPAKLQHRRDILGQIVCILLVLSLLGTMVATELIRSHNAVTRRTVVTSTYTRGDEGTGYLIRDERVITTINTGTMDFGGMTDGTAVTASTLIAKVYGNDTGTDERSKAAALYEQIAQREAALAEHEQAWTVDYIFSYTDLMTSLGSGNLRDAQQKANEVSNTLIRRDTAQSEEILQTLRKEIDALYAEIGKLILHEDEPDMVLAGMDGVFYRNTDGYERVFDFSAMGQITPTAFDELIAATPTTVADTVGRIINPNTYYLAFPISEGRASSYTPNSTYTVRFAECGLRIPFTLERIATDTSGNALLILRGTDLPEALTSDRRQNVSIEREVISGLRIPSSALSEKNTVFIDANGTATEIKVTPVVNENGCCLVEASSAEGALKAGDRVLFDANRIYDGKVVN